MMFLDTMTTLCVCVVRTAEFLELNYTTIANIAMFDPPFQENQLLLSLQNKWPLSDWRDSGLDGGHHGQDWTGECRINKDHVGCKVLRDAAQIKQQAKVEGPWADHQNDREERAWRHVQSWNKQFAFAWEVGMFWTLLLKGPLQCIFL